MIGEIAAAIAIGSAISGSRKKKKKKKKARRALARYLADVERIYGEMEGRYQPGGAFWQAGRQSIEEARTAGVGAELQRQVSSGMMRSPRPTELAWEKSYGIPARLSLEDMAAERLTNVQQAKAAARQQQIAQAEEYLSQLGAAQPSWSEMLAAGLTTGEMAGKFATSMKPLYQKLKSYYPFKSRYSAPRSSGYYRIPQTRYELGAL